MSGPRVFAGVLAAGHGTRFQAAGVQTPKALVSVAGRSLLLRTLDAFADAGFDRVALVVNETFGPAVRAHVEGSPPRVAHDLTVKTTASTLETFSTLLEIAGDAERFVFTTVDAVTDEGVLARFAREASSSSLSSAPIVLGVSAVEPGDENPLRVELSPDGTARLGSGEHATAGFYAGRVDVVREQARSARARGVPSLRAFLTQQSALSVVRGIVLGRAVDVDTPADVALAERALTSWGERPGGARVRT
jgi:MurNAc alpha-1-phosphate uridylyltransferase